MNLDRIAVIVGIVVSVIGVVSSGITLIRKVDDILEKVYNNSDNIAILKTDIENALKSIGYLENGMRDVLRQQIIEKTDVIFAKGYITNEEFYCLRKLYKSYEFLNGNSTVEVRVKEALTMRKKVGRFFVAIDDENEMI